MQLLYLLIASAAAEQIHGKDVSDACAKAYKDAFEPELTRTAKYMNLVKLVTQPPELQARAVKAGQALQTYQDILKKVDANLAAPISDEDKKALHEAQHGTDDVAPLIRDLSSNTDEGIKAALKEFSEARAAENKANALVDKACPADIE